jgi:cytochrome b subunit of formate dehydrogenase
VSLAQTAEDCLDCHSDEHLKKDIDDGTNLSLYVDSVMYTNSIHGVLECIDCHSSIEDLDHNENLPRVNCMACHEDILKRCNKGVHGVANMTADGLMATCSDCHGKHDILSSHDPDSKLNKINIEKTCGTCHIKEKDEYLKSIHWLSVLAGYFESPVCNDCHSEHHIVSAKDKDITTNRLNLSSQICVKCHSSTILMKRFGLDPERFSTYQLTDHGLAVLKGSPDAANCTSCHEVHAILPKESPESSVHESNLAQTCGKCHDDTKSDFINIAAHPKDMKTRNPIAYYISKIYIWFIFLIIASMIIHNIIIFRYYIIRKRQALKAQRTIQRFMPFEVYQHALLIISFFILVITGFAFRYPDTFWVEWLMSLGMTETIRSMLHRVAAIILVIISTIQIIYFIFHRRGKKEIMLLLPKISDITRFWANMKYYLGKSRVKPKFGRWDYTEKTEYLALIWGTAVMTLTGFILWFPEFFMSFLPSWVFEVSEVIHLFEAWLATLTIIVWHWFFVIFHPEKYPMSLTWLDGRISEDEMKNNHTHEYEEIKKDGK